MVFSQGDFTSNPPVLNTFTAGTSTAGTVYQDTRGRTVAQAGTGNAGSNIALGDYGAVAYLAVAAPAGGGTYTVSFDLNNPSGKLYGPALVGA